jgi:TonB family protein
MRFREHIAVAFLTAALCLPTAASVQDAGQDADTPLKIKSKPQASARGCSTGSGRTSIKVTFDRSGKVTEANTVSASGCGPFDNTAIRAAHGIKFEPARKNGQPVTTIKLVEYTYSIY